MHPVTFVCCISNYRYTKETESATAVAEARLPKRGCRVARGGGEETRGERGVPPPRWKVTGHPSPVIGDGTLGTLWDVWDSVGRLGRSGTLWDALGRSGTLWDALERSGTLWNALGRSGTFGSKSKGGVRENAIFYF